MSFETPIVTDASVEKVEQQKEPKPQTKTPLEAVEEYLLATAPDHIRVRRVSGPVPSLLIGRAGSADLVIKSLGDKLSGSLYGFISPAVREQIMKLLKDSPIEVRVSSTHLHPDGR
jgi:hypothetical protein